MIERIIIPRHPSLFEFFDGSGLTLTVETGEHKHRKQYVKLYVLGHTLFERVNAGDCTTRPTYPSFRVHGDTLLEATRKMVKLISNKVIYNPDQKPAVKVPILSQHTHNAQDFKNIEAIQEPKAINLFDFINKNDLTLVISTGEYVDGSTFVRAEVKDYGVVKARGSYWVQHASADATNERDALRELIDVISDKLIGPNCYNKRLMYIDETKEIEVPALWA